MTGLGKHQLISKTLSSSDLLKLLISAHLLIIGFNVVAGNAKVTREKISPATSVEKPSETLRGIEIAFTQNKGQFIDLNNKLRPDILFKGSYPGADVYIRSGGLSYVLSNISDVMREINEQVEDTEKNQAAIPGAENAKKQELIKNQLLKLHRVDVDFINCLPNPQTIAERKMDGYSNYYLPQCPQGITGVASYTKVTQKNIYNNVDVVYYGNMESNFPSEKNGVHTGGLKYDLIVKPHADPSQIKLRWTGAKNIQINAQGNLVIKTSVNEFYESIPKVYQNVNGKIVDIKAKYILTRVSAAEVIIGFSLSTYDAAYDLVIDPWATYYGGNYFETGEDICTDKAGNVLVTGVTASVNFPVLGGTQMTYGGIYDAFVVKFNSAGVRQWATYYGGSSTEYGTTIGSDNNNNIVFAGYTQSANFPVLAAYQPVYQGGQDVFVTKLDAAGTPQWSTFYGGTSFDSDPDIAIDFADNIIIGGSTQSVNFPVLSPAQPLNAGSQDAFVAKFNSAGTPQWATFYGGTAQEWGYGVAVDFLGNVMLMGTTLSTNLPVYGGAFQTASGGMSDVFIAKYTSSGVASWATYCGGTSSDYGYGITTDSGGNTILTGQTSSVNFPVVNAYQPFTGGSIDAFITKLNPTGAIIWSTFFGASYNEVGWDVAVDKSDNIYAYLDLETEDIPATSIVDACAIQPIPHGGASANPNGGYIEDQLIVKYNPAGKKLCSTYKGGTGEDDLDSGGGITVNGNSIYITGGTDGGYPVTAGAFQPAIGGVAINAFIASICTNICEAPTVGINFNANITSACPNVPIKFTPTISNSCDTTGTSFHWIFTGGNPSTSDSLNPTIRFSGIGTHDVKLIVNTACKKDSLTKVGYITIISCSTLSSTASKTDVLCNGNSTGSATATAISGTPNYTYSWSNGSSGITSATANTITGLAANTYTVTITDGGSGISITTITVNESPAINAGPATITNSTCAANDGSASVTAATGGSGNFTYNWSNGASGQTANNLGAATYTLTVRDANNCTKTILAIVAQTGGPTVIVTKTNPSCSTGTGTATASVSGGTGILTYNWSNGGITATASNLAAGIYTVTVTDASSCTVTETTSVIIPSPISVTASENSSATCAGNNGVATVITSNGGAAPLTYSWSNGSTGLTATYLSGGTYTLTATDANACTVTTTVQINSGTNPIINGVTVSNPKCANDFGTAIVNASAGTGSTTYSWSVGTNGQTANNLPNGIFTVTVSDANNCQVTTTVNVTSPPAISTPLFTQTNATCGNTDGSVVASASGGTAPLNYTWSNGATGLTITNLAAASYTLTVTDANSCTNTALATVVNTNGPGITVTKTNPSCSTGTGSATATGSGGTAPLTYSWSNASTTSTATNLSTGIYTVTVTDANACTLTETISILIPSAITLTASENSSAGCAGSNGVAVVTGSNGGTPPFTYTWSNGANGLTAANLTPGTYTVTANDANACLVTTTVLINPGLSPAIDVVTVTNPSCSSDLGTAIINASGGTGNLTYSWSTAASGQTVNNLSGGTFTVTVSDASNCQITTTIVITSPPPLSTPTFTQTNASCGNADGSAVASASGGTGNISYSWSNGTTGATAVNLSVGGYTITVIDKNSCSTTASATISNANGPTIALTVVTPIACNGGTGTLSTSVSGGSIPYTYLWSSGASSVTSNLSSQVSNLTANNYSVTITDANGCSNVSTLNLGQPSPISNPTFIVINANCGTGNGSAIAAASGGSGNLIYSWSDNTTGATATNLSAGTYNVTITDGNNCSLSQSVQVNDTPAPVISTVSGVNVLCKGNNTGSAVVNASGNGTLAYVWSQGSTTATASGLSAGNYTVTISDGNGCKTISVINLTEPSTAINVSTTTSNATCGKNNGTSLASVSGGTGSLSFTWSTGSSGANVSGLAVGNYTITVSDLNSCTKSASITINNSAGPTANTSIANSIPCNGGTGSLSASASGGNAPYTYSWSNGVSTITNVQTTQLLNITSNSYSVLITDAQGCTSLSTINLSQPTVLASSISSYTFGCTGNKGSAKVTVAGGTPLYTYSWSNGITSLSSATSDSISNLTDGIYYVIISDSKGCTTLAADTIQTIPVGAINVGAPIQSIIEGSSIALNVTGGTTYTWSPPNGLSCTTCPNPVAQPTSSITYTITTVDGNGCLITATIRVTVKKGCIGDENDLFIANVFSPNNDGVNDLLAIEGNGLANIYWAIYDRWGNLLFEAFDQSHPWDGSKKGNPMESGTYVYYLKALCVKTHTEVKLKGNVTIIK